VKTGERWIAIAIAVVVALAVGKVILFDKPAGKGDEEVPFYSTADEVTAKQASDLYRELNCRECHTIWATKNVMQSVPAPSLDGIGSLRDQAWLYTYFSAKDPQSILPSRLKKQYQHPSTADLPEKDRRLLAKYFASMKVKDWYLEETRKAEQRKLTGKD